MGTMHGICNFFKFSPKRESLLLAKIEELCPESSHTKLKDICKTRWVQCLDSMEVLLELLDADIEVLHNIKMNETGTWDAESSMKANGLYHAILTFDFLFTLTVTRKTLALTKGLTVKLQSRTVDILKSYQVIKLVQDAMLQLRSGVNDYHASYFEEASTLAVPLEVTVVDPRTCGKQKNRPNAPATKPTEYFRISMTVPLLDHLNQELQAQFFQAQETILSGFSLVPSLIVKSPQWKKSVQEFCEFYRDGLPASLSLEAEMMLWELQWPRATQQKSEVPTTIAATLKEVDTVQSPNITKALRILGTMPVTSCECARAVSSLRRLKTYMRSSMGGNRLTGLAMMHVHYRQPVNLDLVVQRFIQMHSRRMEMVDVLAE